MLTSPFLCLLCLIVVTVFFTTTTQAATAKANADEILSFPGYPSTLPSKQYGGYLDAENGNAHLFYMFVESEGNPSTDPIILWLNGGPGCSSLLGYFTEHGPFDPTSGNSVSLRPYRWSRLANVLYLESPAGVGFSYCDNGNYNYNDTRSMNMNYDALVSFFTAYPQYKTNPFYIMGESYAGIYVPMLANNIVENTATFNGPPLLGIGVGNGCTGTDAPSTCSGGFYCSGANCPPLRETSLMPGFCYSIQLRTQYLIAVPAAPEALREAVQKTCNWTAIVPNFFKDQCGLSTECLLNIEAMNSYFIAIDFYNVYGTCVNPNMTTPGTTSCVQQGSAITESVSQSAALLQTLASIPSSYSSSASASSSSSNGNDNKLSQLLKQIQSKSSSSMKQGRKLSSVMVTDTAGVPPSVNDDDTTNTFDSDYWQGLGAPAFCFSQTPYVSEYVNSEAFIKAAHAIRQPFCWGGCNDAESFTYTRSLANTDDIYTNLLVNKGIYVLIYNGDFDGVVPYNDNYDWTFNLANTLALPIAKNWSAWRYTSDIDNSTQNAGFNIKWSVNAGQTGFEFRTVRAAGHTVPQDTPDKAFQLLAHLIGRGDGHFYYPDSSAIDTDSSSSSSSSNNKTLSLEWILVIILGSLLLISVIVNILMATNVIGGINNKGNNEKANVESHSTTESPLQKA